MVIHVLDINLEKCDACMECVQACSKAAHSIVERHPRIQVILNEDSVEHIAVCRHCNPAPCIEACEFDAIRHDGETVYIDQEKCTSCKACITICPFAAISETPRGEIVKCDLCQGTPACVEACPTGALQYKPAHTLRTTHTGAPPRTIYGYLEKTSRRS